MRQLCIMLLLAGSVVAQTKPAEPKLESYDFKSIGETNLSMFSTGYGESSTYVMKRQDGHIEIQGDTLTAVKSLFEELEKRVASEAEAETCIAKGVVWSNIVSDYFKTSKKWKDYQKSLHKQGYKTTRKK